MVTLGVFWIAAYYKTNLGDFLIFWGTVAVDTVAMVTLGVVLK